MLTITKVNAKTLRAVTHAVRLDENTVIVGGAVYKREG
jgi:hypothetical protein